MSTLLLKGASIVNVFTDSLERKNVLIEGNRIIGVDDYDTADEIVDVSGKILCPGFIDGHIHIESAMLIPEQFARAVVPCGTAAVIADPHEIANVCGADGIAYMMENSDQLPVDVYFALPSCVPATDFDENGADLTADQLAPFYTHERVVSLGEVMNYPGVIDGDEELLRKIGQARNNRRVINGHAPLLTGQALDKYIAAGVSDDHECTSFAEAKERVEKGQWVMIRQGTSSRDLEALIELFEEPYSHRCMLVTDDKHPMDLIRTGHIDETIRMAVRLGKSVFTGIRMASLQPAEYYGLRNTGALAPGYRANILVLNDLDTVDICAVYHNGRLVCRGKQPEAFAGHKADPKREAAVRNTFNIGKLDKCSFHVEADTRLCHVIRICPGELLTDDLEMKIDFSVRNGVDTDRDIIKLAVCERHKGTGHIGIGFVNGFGIKKGAIASTVSHDSHNLIVAGTSDEEMALAANTCIEMGGGLAVVLEDRVLARLALPIGGLMTDEDALSVAEKNEAVRKAVHFLGAGDGIEPFMNMAFLSLTVIPHIKITSNGLFNVDMQAYY